METIYLVCAAIGGTLIVCQFAMTLFGLGGHLESADGDISHSADAIDAHHDHAVGHGNESTWFAGLLTARTLSAGLAFFGLVGVIGLQADLHDAVSFGLALLAGLSSIFIVAWIMRALVRLNIDGTVRIQQSLGCTGTVYLPIPADNAGQGKVQISVLHRTVEYKAVSAKEALPTGRKVKVVEIVSSDTVAVAPVDDTD